VERGGGSYMHVVMCSTLGLRRGRKLDELKDASSARNDSFSNETLAVSV
jgi:hypothetical protein